MTSVTAGTIEMALLAVSSERIARRIAELASIGATPDGGVSRLGLTLEERAARELVASWLSRLGYRCASNDACNLFCSVGPSPRVLIGSHLDSVPGGGRYDGALGVVAAIELAEAVHAAGLALPLEIVAWSAEEGARYRPGHFGSSATFGQLPPDAWERSLADGRVVREAVRDLIGREPEPSTCLRPASDFTGYLELHTEQGPRLAEIGAPLGAVTSIVGMTRARIAFTGRPDHAGTTPMNLRSDALAAAAECVLAVERVAQGAAEELVGTVGEVNVTPGAANVVPGTCHVSIELRAARDEVRRGALVSILEAVAAACERRAVRWRVEAADEIPATALAPKMIEAVAAACARLGVSAPRMSSGAGHDAQNLMLAGVPAGMIFVRSHGGSHNPHEHATPEDTALGTQALMLAAISLAEAMP